MAQKFEYVILDLIESTAKNFKSQPMNLGGLSGAGGGIGAPPGGYIGWLPQTRVAYDDDEIASSGITASGTLLDNLNHIRYRLDILEAGTLIVDELDGIPTVSGVNHITFSGGATVTDLGGGHVVIGITASGGGGGGIPEAPSDSKYYSRRNAAWSDIAGAFLKLDASNDPLTGTLDISVNGVNDEAIIATQTVVGASIYSTYGFDLIRTGTGVGPGTLGRFSAASYAIGINDVHPFVVYSGGTLTHSPNGANGKIDINLYAPSTGTLTEFNSVNSIGASGRLLTLKNQNTEKFAVNGTGEQINIFPLTLGGRLTLTSNTPVLTSDVADAATIYYTPYIHNIYPSYNGSLWTQTAIAELSLALDSNAGHTGYHQSGKLFDLFLYNDGGTIRLVSGPAWTNDTTRATALERVNGILMNAASMTGRFGSSAGDTVTVAQDRGTFVGTFYASANGQTTFELGGTADNGDQIRVYLWNMYNRRVVVGFDKDSTNTWNYTTATWRSKNNSATNRASMVRGIDEDPVEIINDYAAYNTNIGTNQMNSVGLDSTTTQAACVILTPVSEAVASNNFMAQCVYKGYPGLGFHYLQIIERGAGAGTTTFIGDANAPDIVQTGFTFETQW